MKISFLTRFFFAAYVSYAQTNAITIRFIGNWGLSLTDGTSNIYIDFLTNQERTIIRNTI